MSNLESTLDAAAMEDANDHTAVANAEGVATKRKLGIGFWIALTWLGVVVFCALFAPWLPFKDPDQSIIQPGERPPYSPSTTHPFGTDQDARDMLSRTVFGARVSLTVGFVAIAMGMFFGGLMGILAGYFRGWWATGTQPADDLDHPRHLEHRSGRPSRPSNHHLLC